MWAIFFQESSPIPVANRLIFGDFSFIACFKDAPKFMQAKQKT